MTKLKSIKILSFLILFHIKYLAILCNSRFLYPVKLMVHFCLLKIMSLKFLWKGFQLYYIHVGRFPNALSFPEQTWWNEHSSNSFPIWAALVAALPQQRSIGCPGHKRDTLCFPPWPFTFISLNYVKQEKEQVKNVFSYQKIMES